MLLAPTSLAILEELLMAETATEVLVPSQCLISEVLLL
jgi:hypothetical protein